MDKIFGSWSWWPWSNQVIITTVTAATTTATATTKRAAAVAAAAASTQPYHHHITTTIPIRLSSSVAAAAAAATTVATSHIPILATTQTTKTSTVVTAANILKSSSSSLASTLSPQPFIVTTATKISTALSNLIQNDMLMNNGTSTLMHNTSTTSTIDQFGNDTLFDSNDFTEDELLFRLIWSNATTPDAVDALLERNGTNGTHGSSDIDFENTWHLVTTIVTAVVLGFIILATVIGKC